MSNSDICCVDIKSQPIIQSSWCYRCSRKGHSFQECSAKTYANGYIIDDDQDEELSLVGTIVQYFKEFVYTVQRCNRCNRRGHDEEDCYATKHADGHFLRRNLKK